MSTARYARGALVYSTDAGRRCPVCGEPVSACLCRGPSPAAAKGDGIVRVSRETKGRGGKGVTLVTGLALGEAELAALAKELKARCGTGGTVKDGVIELQGEHRDALVAELGRRGYTIKRAGG